MNELFVQTKEVAKKIDRHTACAKILGKTNLASVLFCFLKALPTKTKKSDRRKKEKKNYAVD